MNKLIKKFQNPSGPIKDRQQQLCELDWSPESWFALRTPKPDETLYNEEEASILASHVPEYKKIERKAKKNGTWLKMPDGSTWEGDPRSWVMMQSKAFQKNYSSQPWYTGQGEWETQYDYPDDEQGNISTNKVTRAPYHNGQMWFSNEKMYGDAFAYYYDKDGIGSRFKKGVNIGGKNFLAAIPKKGNYRDLEPPKQNSDWWQSMPYNLEIDKIVRIPDQDITNGTGKLHDSNVRKDNKKVLTDDVVNWSNDLGDDGIFLHNVNDGGGALNVRGKWVSVPIKGLEEFISQPGFTNKVKFIEGNTGDFDINDPYKYAENSVKRNDQDVYYAKQGEKLIPKHEKGSPVNTNPLPKHPINTNPVPEVKPKKKKGLQIRPNFKNERPTPGMITFPVVGFKQS